MTANILRRGRLNGVQNEQIVAFTSSMEADRWIFDADMLVDKAYVVMLSQQGIISRDDASGILSGLKTIEKDGIGVLDGSYEDVHIAIEARLIELTSENTGGRMHSGRSRNDEVATCIRIALRGELLELAECLVKLRSVFIIKADNHVDTVMPGFTHLQHAQPTTFAHHLLAHACALERDFERLTDAYKRINLCPLGAAAFASTGFPLDRDYVCKLLGFDALLENSMDAVSTRDFIIEILGVCSNLMVDISRFAEETILWSTSEFGFIELSDAYSSTSSIMPQKKNPDISELLRAKTGSVHGALMSVLYICKALPYSYNRDLQEVTPHLQKAVGITKSAVSITTDMLSTLKVHKELLHQKSTSGFSTATELADTIVRVTGLPFRLAHQIVGSAVREGNLDFAKIIEIGKKVTGKNLEDIGLRKEEFLEALDPLLNINRRNIKGGPAPSECTRSIIERGNKLSHDQHVIQQRIQALDESEHTLDAIVDTFETHL
ncbi:MAG: Argininosuccinate lyase [Candidatus Argoarchaeum ethanivorans]|uniref:Argininosuccinate lyase n=1 Tax=Candidatus Argoarchaeum ethanivorans TaxID=2608793 RepID=A0A811T7F6_9EURY|nr:MAG: Argininosuccinate lyase [Candidatus Argoarchaeum ethanivorans]